MLDTKRAHLVAGTPNSPNELRHHVWESDRCCPQLSMVIWWCTYCTWCTYYRGTDVHLVHDVCIVHAERSVHAAHFVHTVEYIFYILYILHVLFILYILYIPKQEWERERERARLIACLIDWLSGHLTSGREHLLVHMWQRQSERERER